MSGREELRFVFGTRIISKMWVLRCRSLPFTRDLHQLFAADHVFFAFTNKCDSAFQFIDVVCMYVCMCVCWVELDMTWSGASTQGTPSVCIPEKGEWTKHEKKEKSNGTNKMWLCVESWLSRSVISCLRACGVPYYLLLSCLRMMVIDLLVAERGTKNEPKPKRRVSLYRLCMYNIKKWKHRNCTGCLD